MANAVLDRRTLLAAALASALPAHAAKAPLLAGGDISALTWMEHAGAVYKDRDGKPGDCLEILKRYGHNIVRIRMYDRTGPGTGNDGWYWPAGSMDLADVLRLARRAKAQGMQIQFTLHYSDFWTNSKTQTPPTAWRKALDTLGDDTARFERLLAFVEARSRLVVKALVDQGTPPEFVSLGNEIEHGLLYPWGSTSNWQRLGAILKAGYAGVKAAHPAAKIVLHLDDGGNEAKYIDWFDHAREQGVKWDVIGPSYYPFWTKKNVSQLMSFCDTVSARYDSDMLVMEAGFNFAPNRADGWPGQLENNGPYPASMSSPEGQRDFMAELLGACKAHPRVLGVLYWDPIFIANRNVGWALKEGTGEPGPNVVSNTTLFDFKGRALPVLDIWKQYTQ
ncbi:glycosyl hydrolase 53 family protein [Roseateles sp. BYS78W]|uniref:Arabinogalactan endo-beta-1,4-galactanase n=1 Tax=Pelomonas candidula TaxID=3299025 RepID=A0ABW7HDZ8_9BURK